MSVSDNSDFEMNSCDIEESIVKALSSGPKTPGELLNWVLKETKVNERTYYRHLDKLLKSNAIEESIEHNRDSRSESKYYLKSSPLLAKPEPLVEEVLPSRRYLEIAAWLKKEPDNWPQLDAIRKARIVLNNFGYIVPTIEDSYKDPDRYTFVWSDEACRGQRYGEFVQPRFFKLKDIYRAIVADYSASSSGEAVFVGAFESDVMAEQVVLYEDIYRQIEFEHKPVQLKIVEEPFSVCVAVCKEVDGGLRVVYVEGKSGKIDKEWVKGVSKQLTAKYRVISTCKDLKEDTKRKVLLKFRIALEKQTLKIPSRYVKLVEELLDYDYHSPSSGYVHAIALAVDIADRKS